MSDSNKFSLLKDANSDGSEDDDQKSSLVPLPTEKVECPEGEHKLQYNYTLWYSKKAGGKVSYDQHLKPVATFPSVESFWRYYSNITHIGDLSPSCDYHLFKGGIRPMWEDSANEKGGKWIVRLKKGLSSRCWENLVVAMLGEQFMVGEEICGAVISNRFNEDILSLWNRSSADQNATARIRDTLKRVLNLPANTVMEYKTHNNSLKDRSSYRNTDIFTH